MPIPCPECHRARPLPSGEPWHFWHLSACATLPFPSSQLVTGHPALHRQSRSCSPPHWELSPYFSPLSHTSCEGPGAAPHGATPARAQDVSPGEDSGVGEAAASSGERGEHRAWLHHTPSPTPSSPRADLQSWPQSTPRPALCGSRAIPGDTAGSPQPPEAAEPCQGCPRGARLCQHPHRRAPAGQRSEGHVPKMPGETPVLSHLSGCGGNKRETLQILMQLSPGLGSRPRQPERQPVPPRVWHPRRARGPRPDGPESRHQRLAPPPGTWHLHLSPSPAPASAESSSSSSALAAQLCPGSQPPNPPCSPKICRRWDFQLQRSPNRKEGTARRPTPGGCLPAAN